MGPASVLQGAQPSVVDSGGLDASIALARRLGDTTVSPLQKKEKGIYNFQKLTTSEQLLIPDVD